MRSRAVRVLSLLGLSVLVIGALGASGTEGAQSLVVQSYQDVIRFQAQGAQVEQLRLQVYSLAGEAVFDSGLQRGRVLDWRRTSRQGERLAYGIYLYRVELRDRSGNVLGQKVGKLAIGSAAAGLRAEEPLPALGESGEDRLSRGRVRGQATGSACGVDGNTCGTNATVSGGTNNTASGELSTVGGGGSNEASGEESTVSGGSGNTASGLLSTVGGGLCNRAGNFTTRADCSEATDPGDQATVGGGSNNLASGLGSTVGGGSKNTASGPRSTVGGGQFNTASGDSSTVGGGSGSTAGGFRSTVGGGQTNEASGDVSTVGGGNSNTASGLASTVGGGDVNAASGFASTVGGGQINTASGTLATVGGGRSNEASGQRSTVPGGDSNVAAGDYSFAAGRRAQANHDGAFVWADSTDADFASTAADQFLIRASGGVGIGTNTILADPPAAILLEVGQNTTGPTILVHNRGGAGGAQFRMIDDASGADFKFKSTGTGGFKIRDHRNRVDVIFVKGDGSGNVGFRVNNPVHPLQMKSGAHVTAGGVWTNASDRALKENFREVDRQGVLARLAALPIRQWNYKAEEESILHIGPTAQDFYAAFGLGGSDTTIGTVDGIGVALVSIQALYEQVQAKDEQIAQLIQEVSELRAANRDLQAQMTTLLARLSALEQEVAELRQTK